MELHSYIDFYVDGEGEVAFSSIVKIFKYLNGDKNKIKLEAKKINGIHQVDCITCSSPRIKNLEEIPSPYLTGIMDKFFDENLTPLLQTSRGCPYSCTFCHDGSKYSSKLYRFDNQRVKSELEYVATKTKVPSLTLADLNWGIFPEDLDVAKIIKEIQNKFNWPKNIQSATAKNQKDRIVEISKILGGSLIIGASIQSNDEDVLNNIKRKNISYNTIVKMAKESASLDSTTFTEIILCLPGDTKEKHIKTVIDMLDAGIEDIHLYQYILLPGTEGANDASRKSYEYQTRFRVIPRCIGFYDVVGESHIVAEIHEVAVGSATMPHQDYLDCRKFDLTLWIFNNGQIMDEIYKSLSYFGISRSEVILEIHNKVSNDFYGLNDIYEDYIRDEESNFWKSKEDLKNFIMYGGGFKKYISGELGRNQLHYWKCVAIFQRLDKVLNLAIECSKNLLAVRKYNNEITLKYLDDLYHYILFKKSNPTDIENDYFFQSSFDFSSLIVSDFLIDPFSVIGEKNHSYILGYDNEQKHLIKSYFAQYGSDLIGLAHLTHRYPAKILHRKFIS